MICQICNEIYEDNHSGLGKFYMHLKKAHNVSKKDYVTKFEYNGNAPNCLCGCDEEPHWSNRNGYSKYAKGHNKFKHREKQYIKEHGQPICSNEGCNRPVSFSRAMPNTYCSKKCSGQNTGWSLERTQAKVKSTLRERYGVDNSYQIPEVIDRIATHNMFRKHSPLSEETKLNIGKATTKRWHTQREFMAVSVAEGVRNSEIHSRSSSQKMKKQRKDPAFIKAMHDGQKNKLSNLHIKVREQMNLEAKGFLSEQTIGPYRVDEFNPKTKEVIEVNGDYVHANPKIYSADDIIRLRGNSYKASYKWQKDREKIDWLLSQGYTVTVIWESDIK